MQLLGVVKEMRIMETGRGSTDRILWRVSFVRGCGQVVGQNREMNEYIYIYIYIYIYM
jgi:hypothetical protein